MTRLSAAAIAMPRQPPSNVHSAGLRAIPARSRRSASRSCAAEVISRCVTPWAARRTLAVPVASSSAAVGLCLGPYRSIRSSSSRSRPARVADPNAIIATMKIALKRAATPASSAHGKLRTLLAGSVAFARGR